jgi:hypothetical protein
MHLPLWRSSRNFVIEVGPVTQASDYADQTQGRASRLSSQFHQIQQDSNLLPRSTMAAYRGIWEEGGFMDDIGSPGNLVDRFTD